MRPPLSLGEFALEERPLRGSLADDLAAVALSPLTIYWIGQAGFILRHADGPVIVMDPYLSDSLAEKYRGKIFPTFGCCPCR
jgi:hypothetical protein